MIDQIRELILENRRISAKSIAEQLGISHERVEYVEALREVGVPKCLNVDQKRQCASRLSKFSNFFGEIQMISCRDW